MGILSPSTIASSLSHIIGAPIDFLVFKGMDAQSIEEVIFVEVKSGAARLNHNEHSLKDAIENASAGTSTASPFPSPNPPITR